MSGKMITGTEAVRRHIEDSKVEELFRCLECGKVYDSKTHASGCNHQNDDEIRISARCENNKHYPTVTLLHDGFKIVNFDLLLPRANTTTQEMTIEAAKKVIKKIKVAKILK